MMCRLFQSEGPGDESHWDGAQRQDSEVSLQTQFHDTICTVHHLIDIHIKNNCRLTLDTLSLSIFAINDLISRITWSKVN